MRLRRLDLTRYGKFTSQSLDFGAAPEGRPDLHIVYGLNEAGKSTALSAYLDLLFGIENNSRFDFLHPYSSMQVGGQLEFTGRAHELVRVKARINSLQDGKGEPVNEALLSVPLAGLTRESYRSMFSLDDQSLEDGGNAIIASRGELGELLFAASAGLADLGAILAKVRDEADTIHKQRGRNTQIAELKRTLLELKAEQDSIDTRASAHAALVAAVTQAEAAYEAAIGEQSAARTRHEELTRLLRAAPLAVEYRRLLGEIEATGSLPAPPAEWAGQLSDLMIRNAELGTQIAGTEADLVRLDEEIAAIAVDEPVLALGNRIRALDEGLARYSTAESDLPRRRTAIAEDEAQIAVILSRLGQAGHAAPETLLLAAPLIGTLRDLIEARSGIDARLDTAQRELVQAREALERVKSDAEVHAGGNAPDPAKLAGVNAALGRLRQGNHQARIRLEERSLPGVRRRYQTLLDGLLPWTGDGDALRGLRVPEGRQIDGWRMRAVSLERRLGEQSDRQRELVTAEREQRARIAAIVGVAGAIDDAEAARLRQARDAAWAEHVGALDAATAAAFLRALEADDALAEARLRHVQDLAELRSLQQGLAVTAASLSRQAELDAEAEAEVDALRGEIQAGVEGQITLPPAMSLTGWLEAVESWSRRRVEVLAAWDALAETEDDRAGAAADLARDVAVLVEAMALAGLEGADDLSPDALMQAAETALTQGKAQEAAQAAAARGLREREADLALRERALAEARSALEGWQAAWTAALGQTWFSESGVGAVREALVVLSELPAALTQRNGRARQIDTMERDQRDLADGVAVLVAELGGSVDPTRVVETAQGLKSRLEGAEQNRRLHAQKTAERSRVADLLRGLVGERQVHEARKGEMTAFFGVETLQEVSLEMERAADGTRLRSQIETVSRQLTAELRAPNVDAGLALLADTDLEDAEREAAETAARLEDLEAGSRQRFAERDRASQRLEAVGGDDAVARIEAQRRTVLLQIEDKALDYLRLRTGALVAEKALRAYREQHRSSMMEQASEAFALITKGEYLGLASRSEKDRETLIGLPRQGGSKLAADMSKGTQFQLYLALRLAGYREFARSRPPVPFIADDIMETFDEPRSEQVFRLLGEMAHIGQVVYLTHHRHLCDIAQAVVPGVTIHELTR
jgi:uncharacterized protein YhaN